MITYQHFIVWFSHLLTENRGKEAIEDFLKDFPWCNGSIFIGATLLWRDVDNLHFKKKLALSYSASESYNRVTGWQSKYRKIMIFLKFVVRLKYSDLTKVQHYYNSKNVWSWFFSIKLFSKLVVRETKPWDAIDFHVNPYYKYYHMYLMILYR